MNTVVCKHRVDIENQIYCQKKKKFIEPQYKCSKGECAECEFPTLALVTIQVGRCDECPFHYTERTIGAGYAFDYFCKAAENRKITGYVEYPSEIPAVPSWCPFYLK